MAEIGITNKGTFRILDIVFRGASPTTLYYLALVTDTVVPTVDTKTLGDLEEINAGNGYSSGGVVVEKSSTGFPTIVEDDIGDKSSVTMKDVSITAVGGTMPASGDPISYFVLTGDGAPISSREVYAFGDFEGEVIVLENTPISVNGYKLTLKKPS